MYEKGACDYEYFKELGWMESDYFYETKLGLVKKLIGKLIDRQAVKMGRKMVRKRAGYKRKNENVG